MAEKRLMKGNEAFATAAMNAGCRFYFGYPITPQNEVPEFMSRELPLVGGSFIQAESELAAINMAYGASAAGGRVMLSTSSPGIALMQEGLSLLSAVQLPIVLVSVMRGGPGVGSIQPGQADYEQATKGGGNGDYHTIVFAPSSIQEACDMIYEGFDIADEYRNPVMICADGMIGQMMEPVLLPPAKPDPKEEDIPKIKPWAVTGFNHTADGKVRDRNVVASLRLQQELLEEYIHEYWPKYEKAERELQDWENINVKNCETLFVSYGTTSRITEEAMKILEADGINCGLIRLKSLWPFPHKAFEEIGPNLKRVICCELSMGQMKYDVDKELKGKYPTYLINRLGGMLLDPEEVAARAKEILEVK